MPEMTSDEWLSAHRDRVDKFYEKGLDFKPHPVPLFHALHG